MTLHNIIHYNSKCAPINPRYTYSIASSLKECACGPVNPYHNNIFFHVIILGIQSRFHD